MDEGFPPKPKGMHWRTYRRLKAADNIWAAGMMEKFGFVL
jgi:hypothetical protein